MSKLSYEDKIYLYNERKNGCSMGTLSKKYTDLDTNSKFKGFKELFSQ